MKQEAPNQATTNGQLHLLGPIYCWAVVFIETGASVYYIPGILYGTMHNLAGFFVFLTICVFALLTLKYTEVAYRFPHGVGVVTVANESLNHWFGLLGGIFILIDLFLTVAMSCLSSIHYLSVVIPILGSMVTVPIFGQLQPLLLLLTLIILILLGVLNWIETSKSVKVSLVGAVIAFVSDLAILFTVFTHISFSYFLSLFPKMFANQALTPTSILIGFAGSFFAFTSLESISQLSPVMRTPRNKVAAIALFLVVLTIGLTSPLLTMLSILILQDKAGHVLAANPLLSTQLISLLGGRWGGRYLQIEVAISASALLILVSNSAIINSCYIFMALARLKFFPTFLLIRNKLRGTPHYSIAFATGIPMLILLLVAGNIHTLAAMYAFGLLGSFILICISLDLIRYRERKVAFAKSHTSRGEQHSDGQEVISLWSTIKFWLGILTTVLVVIAWSTNLVAKPMATAFGGTVSAIGLIVGYIYYVSNIRKNRIPVIITDIKEQTPDSVVAALTAGGDHNDAVLLAAIKEANTTGHLLVFLYIGKRFSEEQRGRVPRMFEIVDPYLNDLEAKECFEKAGNLAQKARITYSFVYQQLESEEAIPHFWQLVQPRDMVIGAEKEALYKNISSDNIRYELTPEGKVVHLLKHHSMTNE